MSDTLFSWALGFNGVIILSLIGVIWGMRAGELKRIESGLQKEIDRLSGEVKDVRDRKHDHEDLIMEHAGTLDMLKDDHNAMRTRLYLIEQILEHHKIADMSRVRGNDK